MKRFALVLAAALTLAACAAPIDDAAGQCEPGVADISAQAAVVPCT
jgi:hypothetical protein